MKQTVTFVSYDGSYPNLCSGTLVLAVDGQPFTFESHALVSNGSVTFDEHWSETVSSGPWSVREWPPGFPKNLHARATTVINSSVPHGCCGGCV